MNTGLPKQGKVLGSGLALLTIPERRNGRRGKIFLRRGLPEINPNSSCADLIRVFYFGRSKGVDGPDKPRQDETRAISSLIRPQDFPPDNLAFFFGLQERQ
jgi:hypothetical protein